MKKGVMIIILLVLITALALGFILPKTGFIISQNDIIDKNYLESLRVNVDVECLQNSQCSEDYECVANSCIDKKEINLCVERSLSLPVRRLEVGEPINSEVEAITKDTLPFLLPDGELVKIVDDKAIEYFYKQAIFVGANKIEKENEDYFIKEENNEPLYTYKLYFSNGVDFSDKNIQGQTLRILGKEYIIGSKSTNSEVYLVSDGNILKLENSKDVKITTDEKGDIDKIEILYFLQNEMKISESNIDSMFNSIKLSFNSVDKNGFVDATIGGNC
jgi:hypothetical protein